MHTFIFLVPNRALSDLYEFNHKTIIQTGRVTVPKLKYTLNLLEKVQLKE